MTRKRTPAYWRMSRTMTQSAPIFTWRPLQNRKTLQGKEDAPQRGGLPEAKRRVSTTGAQVASDAKAWVSLLSEGKKVRNKVNIPRSGDVYLREGKSWEPRSQTRTNVSLETFLLAVRGGIFRRGKGFPKLNLRFHFHMQGGSWQLPDEAEQQGNGLPAATVCGMVMQLRAGFRQWFISGLRSPMQSTSVSCGTWMPLRARVYRPPWAMLSFS